MPGSSLPLLKGVFPFRLSVPSFIIPADILPNVRFLGPHVDEIELLFFESASAYCQSLPGRDTIARLGELADALDVRYNVHLPIDLYPGDCDAEIRRRAGETLLRFYDRISPLHPSCYVLHLERCRPGREAEPEDVWLKRCRDSLGWMIDRGMDPSRVAVENLNSPPQRMQDMVLELGFKLCLDIGHLLLAGEDLQSMLQTCLPETVMIHLHGVREGRDHRSLENIGSETWTVLSEQLSGYGQGLSVEVFSRDKLQRSLPLMERFRT